MERNVSYGTPVRRYCVSWQDEKGLEQEGQLGDYPGRAFTPVELHDKLEEMSGKNLGISQIRRYAREWG